MTNLMGLGPHPAIRLLLGVVVLVVGVIGHLPLLAVVGAVLAVAGVAGLVRGRSGDDETAVR
jgi:hypothetical protein